MHRSLLNFNKIRSDPDSGQRALISLWRRWSQPQTIRSHTLALLSQAWLFCCWYTILMQLVYHRPGLWCELLALRPFTRSPLCYTQSVSICFGAKSRASDFMITIQPPKQSIEFIATFRAALSALSTICIYCFIV